MAVHRIEDAASELSAPAAQSRHDRKVLNRRIPLLLPLVTPASPLEQRALAQAKQIIERWRIGAPRQVPAGARNDEAFCGARIVRRASL
jgi:hypothetical protein